MSNPRAFVNVTTRVPLHYTQIVDAALEMAGTCDLDRLSIYTAMKLEAAAQRIRERLQEQEKKS